MNKKIWSLVVALGGLGILAGDHCKAASDARLAFVGVGLLYRQGYFFQTIDHDGNQNATYHDSDFEALPIRPALDAKGQEVLVMDYTDYGRLDGVWLPDEVDLRLRDDRQLNRLQGFSLRMSVPSSPESSQPEIGISLSVEQFFTLMEAMKHQLDLAGEHKPEAMDPDLPDY